MKAIHLFMTTWEEIYRILEYSEVILKQYNRSIGNNIIGLLRPFSMSVTIIE